MYRRALALALLFFVPAVPIVLGGVEIFAPASDVSFAISTEHRTGPYQEQVVVKYRITNVGRNPLYVPRGPGASCWDSNHFDVWFVDGRPHGYGGSCPGLGPSLSERMSQSATLLRPGDHVDGTLIVDPRTDNLPSGNYRIEAAVWGWNEEQFSQAERNELENLGSPLLEGEKRASMSITLTR